MSQTRAGHEAALQTPPSFEWIRAAIFALAIVWINISICRDLFINQTGYTNSMHGFWAALAQRAGDSWWWPHWWPYWDCGLPFELAYAPLVPGLTALWAAMGGIPHTLAFQCVSGLTYCLVPLTLFLMAWLLTRAPGWSFLAALFYSLTAPTQLIVPDGDFNVRHFWDARRFYLVVAWDDTPHLLALALLPLVILFLSLAIRQRRPVYYAAATVSIALATLASAFGPIVVAMAALCLLFVLHREDALRNIGLTIAIGAFAYAICLPFLSPLGIHAIRAASKNSGEGWSAASWTAIAIVALGWTILWRYLPRWTADWRLQFFALFAYLTSSVPVLSLYFHRQFVPQPGRYKLEMELGLALIFVFGLRPWVERRSKALKAALLFLSLALAGEQIASFREYAAVMTKPTDLSETIEYHASTWAGKNLPGVRVMMPGMLAQWANAFSDSPQFSGSSWSVALNQVQQRGLTAVYDGGATPERDARVSLAFLRAYGVGAVGVSRPNSQKYWMPFAHPAKFDGVLPVLWHEDDLTIYRIPRRTESLAHVMPESAIVGRSDLEDLERYTAALEDASLPVAHFAWQGRDRIRIHANASPGQVISVQVTSHRGWHAKVNGVTRQLKRDGLGLMWFRPECNGPCDATLEYDGGSELRICRVISYAAVAGLVVFCGNLLRRRIMRSQRAA